MKLTLEDLETEHSNLPMVPVNNEEQRLKEAVKHILYLHDFMNIAYCCRGEFYLEAQHICSRLNSCKLADDVATLVDSAFSHYFLDWSQAKKTISSEDLVKCSTDIWEVYQRHLTERK